MILSTNDVIGPANGTSTFPTDSPIFLKTIHQSFVATSKQRFFGTVLAFFGHQGVGGPAFACSVGWPAAMYNLVVHTTSPVLARHATVLIVPDPVQGLDRVLSGKT